VALSPGLFNGNVERATWSLVKIDPSSGQVSPIGLTAPLGQYQAWYGGGVYGAAISDGVVVHAFKKVLARDQSNVVEGDAAPTCTHTLPATRSSTVASWWPASTWTRAESWAPPISRMASTAICLCSDSFTCLSPSLLQHCLKACNPPRSILPPPIIVPQRLSPDRRSCLSLALPTDRFLLSGQCGSGQGANKKKVGCLLQRGVCLISPFSELRFHAQSTALRFSNFPPNRGHELRETTPGQQARRLLAIRLSLHCSSRPLCRCTSVIDSSIELGQEDTYITHSIRFFFPLRQRTARE